MKSIKRVPCPDGIPLTRIHDVQCLCGHKFKVDLGVEWKPNQIIRCPECKAKLGETMEAISKGWRVEE